MEADFGFGGLYRLLDTGLSLATFRAYNPANGRWLSPDLIGLAGGNNLYGYAGNNPINFVDPLGLDWQDYVPNAIFPIANWGAGLGDNLSFGLTGYGRDLGDLNDVINRNSGAYDAGQWTGTALSAGTGVVGGIKAAGRKCVGKEFSHWLPKRLGGPRSILNGNFVSQARHYMHDPSDSRSAGSSWVQNSVRWFNSLTEFPEYGLEPL